MLRKRLLRNLKHNFSSYLALFLLITLGMFFIISLIASADTITRRMQENAEKVNVEEGEFTTYFPVPDSTLDDIREQGIDIEEQFYLDYAADDSTLRAFVDRKKINLFQITEGDICQADSEICLEHHYAKAHGIEVGDSFTIAGAEFTVSGTGCIPDYETPLENLSDPSIDSKSFGFAILSEEGYDLLKETGEAEIAESYSYAYVLNDKMTDSEFKDYLEEEDVILLSFLIQENNSRIGEAAEDVSMNRVSGIVGGVILFILVGFVISIFQINAIEKESSIIGTLYALGITRKEMLIHYLQLPFYVTLAAGICGTALGFAPFGLGIQLASSTDYYSLPNLEIVYPVYLMLYGILAPPAIITLVNVVLLNRKLGQKPLKLLRHERKVVKASKLKLQKFKFNTSFMIRQLIREYKCRAAMVVGVFFSILLIMMAMNIHVCIRNLIDQNNEDCNFGYMYVMKMMPDQIPDGASIGYIKKYNCDAADGSDIQISILGISPDNPCFQQIPVTDSKEVIASTSVAIKMKAKAGDTLLLEDKVEDETIELIISDVAQYSIGTYVFMDIDQMREFFGEENDYYNVLFSDEELDLDHTQIYSTTTKENIKTFSEVLNSNMRPLTLESALIAVLVFVVIIYLMMKFIIDRSEFSIAIMRIFGYSHSEIYKLYMSCDIVIFLIALLISIPSGKVIMDALWPMFVAHVSVGLDLSYAFMNYTSIFLFAVVVYIVIMVVLSIYLKKMENYAPETLKERE